jgi:hypothetical protein
VGIFLIGHDHQDIWLLGHHSSSPYIATPPSANAPGDASLNAGDRLAIIDLFGAYAQDYDAGNSSTRMKLLRRTCCA